jgi:hypothetical protein
MVVVEVTPALDEHTNLVHVSEPLAIEAFIAQLAVEAFDVGILPWTVRDEHRTHILIPQPAPEFSPISAPMSTSIDCQ